MAIAAQSNGSDNKSQLVRMALSRSARAAPRRAAWSCPNSSCSLPAVDRKLPQGAVNETLIGKGESDLAVVAPC